MVTDPCRCGHPRVQHEHTNARKTHCSLCGSQNCPAYRRPPADWTLAAALRLNRLFAIIRRRS
jgi:hypothetical protein